MELTTKTGGSIRGIKVHSIAYINGQRRYGVQLVHGSYRTTATILSCETGRVIRSGCQLGAALDSVLLQLAQKGVR